MDVMVGIGIIIVRDGKLLVSRRLEGCKTGVGAWSVPGGKIEYGESIRDAVIREAGEEVGVDVFPMRFNIHSYVFHVQEHRRPDFHFITNYVRAGLWNFTDKPRNTEPEKHSDWEWVTLSELAARITDKDWIAFDALSHHRKFLNLR